MGLQLTKPLNQTPYYQNYTPAASYQPSSYFGGPMQQGQQQQSNPYTLQMPMQQQPVYQPPMYQPSMGPKGSGGMGPKGGMGGGFQQPMYQPQQPQAHINYMNQAPQYSPAPPQAMPAPTYAPARAPIANIAPKGGMGIGAALPGLSLFR